ncbi:MAG: glycosyltransferase family A protein [Candidatus Baltobacteraceae bacterium]
MNISVVIATKDRAGYLDRALESLGKQIGAPPFEVIVVDNGSTDPTPQIVDHARESLPYEISYIFEERPNRGAARNRGISAAAGEVVLFVDDDIWAPPAFLAAHHAAHTGRDLVVSGPILNVPSYRQRPKPTVAQYSRAFFCTCNVSVRRAALERVGGFDEQFHLYGWEDTELGVRLRDQKLHAKFAWDAYIYHIKPPEDVTLDVELQKTIEKARMAARFVKKNPSARTRLATGAYSLNLLRAKALIPKWSLPFLAGIATDARVPSGVRSFAKAQLLDGLYSQELARGLKREPTQ